MNKKLLTSHSEIIMGIDPGTRITGYGIVKKEHLALTPLDFGTIRPPLSFDLYKRYLIIFESIEQIISKYSPTAIAIETQFVKKNVMSALKLGMARGGAIIAAGKNCIPIYEYAPKKTKLAVVGNGSASKQQMQNMIALLLNLKERVSEDAADALALAICHSHQNLKN